MIQPSNREKIMVQQESIEEDVDFGGGQGYGYGWVIGRNDGQR